MLRLWGRRSRSARGEGVRVGVGLLGVLVCWELLRACGWDRGNNRKRGPTSASAITGTLGSIDAINEAFCSISFMVAKPRSAMPRRDMLVPAPV